MTTENTLTVILDSEVLKRDPSRRKGPFLALNRLAKIGKIKIYIPEIAVREFLSDQQSKIRTVFEKNKSSFNSLKKYPIPQQLRDTLDELNQSFEQSEQDTIDVIKQSYN